MTDSYKLRISAEVAEKIRQHAAETYPNECCGALFGRDSGEPGVSSPAREILDLLPLINRRDDSPHNRFSIAPRDIIEADRTAQARSLQLIGWYHSHPDHPARPSAYDREHAWPWYSYVIVSVIQRVPREMTSWRLNDDREGYAEESIEIR